MGKNKTSKTPKVPSRGNGGSQQRPSIEAYFESQGPQAPDLFKMAPATAQQETRPDPGSMGDDGETTPPALSPSAEREGDDRTPDTVGSPVRAPVLDVQAAAPSVFPYKERAASHMRSRSRDSSPSDPDTGAQVMRPLSHLNTVDNVSGPPTPTGSPPRQPRSSIETRPGSKAFTQSQSLQGDTYPRDNILFEALTDGCHLTDMPTLPLMPANSLPTGQQCLSKNCSQT